MANHKNGTHVAEGISEEVQKDYAYWRWRILYSSWFGYAMFYLVRKNIAMGLPGMSEDLGIPRAQLGLFLTLHGLLYGVSKFLNGIWGDRANPRYFMTAGLLLSALMSILFGMSNTVLFFGLFWLINGWFQGMGCPACIKSLSNWYSSSERGFRFAVWNTSHSVGSASVMILGGVLSLFAWYSWRMAFFVPAGIAIVGAFFLFNRLRDTPESLGLPSVEEYHGEQAEVEHGKEEMSRAEFMRFLGKQVFSNPGVWYIAFASFFLYIIRYAILDWGPTFLGEMRGVPLMSAGVMVAAYELSGLTGMLVGGWLMDKTFKGNGSLVSMLAMLLCTVFVVLFWQLPLTSRLSNGILLCAIGFCIYAPQSMLGPIVANMATKKAAATAVGLVGLFSYLSGIVSGWGLGYLVDRYGWHQSFLLVVLAGVAGALFYLIPAMRDYTHKREVVESAD